MCVCVCYQDYVLKQVASRYHQMGWPTNGPGNEGNVLQASYQTEYATHAHTHTRAHTHYYTLLEYKFEGVAMNIYTLNQSHYCRA